MIGEIQKYSCYEYEVCAHPDDDYPAHKYYTYKILCYKNYVGQNNDIESDEYFDTEQEANFAAIGHIDLLENGGG